MAVERRRAWIPDIVVLPGSGVVVRWRGREVA